jgi:hypothetical protein
MAIAVRGLSMLNFSDFVPAVSRSLGTGSTRVLSVLPDQTGRDVCVADE